MNTPATINAGRDEESGLWVIDPAGDGWSMYKYGTDLWYGRSFNSGIDQATIPFDPVNHRFMRIRHSSVGDSIYFEVSPDDLVWTTLPVAKSRSGENISNVHLMLFGFGDNNGNGPSGSPLGVFSWIKSNAPIN